MRKQKGITLIALVITIIVLLILAAVSITALTDEDKGVVIKAKNAAQKTEDASQQEDADIQEIIDYAENELETSVIIGNNIITQYNLGDYLGKKVKYVPSSPSTSYGTSTTYRLFYIDFENYFGDGVGTIYLKADGDDKDLIVKGYENYTSTDNLAAMKKMNPEWAKSKGTATSNSEKIVSWLSDSNVWTDWKDTTTNGVKGYINYVIGAPSIEMYVKSYNAYLSEHNGIYKAEDPSFVDYNGSVGLSKGLAENIKCKYTTDNTTYTAKGYRIGFENVDINEWENKGYYQETFSLFDSSYANGMYHSAYWLSSPPAVNITALFQTAGGTSRVITTVYDNYGYEICPVVSISSNAVLEWN